MPFCPQCGFDLAELAEARAPEPPGEAPPPAEATTPAAPVTAAHDKSPSPPRPPVRAIADRARRAPPVVLAGLLVMIGLIAYGLLTRPSGGSSPPQGGQPAPGGGLASAGIPAPITGLTILSPTDGQAVATKDVNVIGLAPPGVSITQDISFGLDQHATTDGTGHWTIRVGLNEGENKLTFRIGDDSSTRKTIRVIYTPQTP
jgi:hypothetical protein